MVDQALVAQVLQLDESERREIRDAIDQSLDNCYTPLRPPRSSTDASRRLMQTRTTS